MKRPFLTAAVFGVLALWPMFFMNRINQDGEMLSRKGDFQSPVLRLEFMKTEADAEAFFSGDDPICCLLFEKVRQLHLYDTLFLVFYGLMMGVFGWVCFRLTSRRRFLGLVFLAALTACADFYENDSIITVTHAIQCKTGNLASPLASLQFFTWLKWLAGGVWLLLAATFFWEAACWGRIAGWLGKLVAISFVGIGVLSFVARFSEDVRLENGMALSVMISIAGLFIFCLFFKSKMAETAHFS